MPILATKDELDSFANRIQQQHDAILALIKNINTEADMMTAKWLGAARQAYDPVMDAYFQKAAKLNDQLLQSANTVAETGRQFTASDEDFRNQFVSSSVDLT